MISRAFKAADRAATQKFIVSSLAEVTREVTRLSRAGWQADALVLADARTRIETELVELRRANPPDYDDRLDAIADQLAALLETPETPAAPVKTNDVDRSNAPQTVKTVVQDVPQSTESTIVAEDEWITYDEACDKPAPATNDSVTAAWAIQHYHISRSRMAAWLKSGALPFEQGRVANNLPTKLVKIADVERMVADIKRRPSRKFQKHTTASAPPVVMRQPDMPAVACTALARIPARADWLAVNRAWHPNKINRVEVA